MALPDPDTEYPRSRRHRDAVLAAASCGCFSCLRLFPPSQIDDWIDEDDDGVGQTALCPRCGTDAVLPVRAGIDEGFLRRMNRRWL